MSDRPVHFALTYCRPVCMVGSKRRPYNPFSTTILSVSDWPDVTCQRCLKHRPPQPTQR